MVAVPLDLRSAPDFVERVISRISPKLAFTSQFTLKGDVDLSLPEITFEELGGAQTFRQLAAFGPVVSLSGRQREDHGCALICGYHVNLHCQPTTRPGHRLRAVFSMRQSRPDAP